MEIQNCNNCGQEQNKCECAESGELSEVQLMQRLIKDINLLRKGLLYNVSKPLKAKYGDMNYDIEKAENHKIVNNLKNSLKDKIGIYFDLIKADEISATFEKGDEIK